MSNSDSEDSVSSGRSCRKNVPSSSSSVHRLSKLKNVGGMLEKPAELFRKDLISAMKLPDTECLFPEDYILISDQWRQDWEKGVQVPVNPESEKHCEVKVLKENECMNGAYGFRMPKKLLHAVADDKYKQSVHGLHETHKLAEEVCRYDIDGLDEAWLKNFNCIREECGLEELSGWVIEKVIEELETRCSASLKAAEAAGMEYDEDTVCDVCRMPDVEEGNEMIFCDGCDIGVHQACYGVLKIPKGSWVCRTCALGLKPRCVLCTSVGGAMKSTRDGSKWAHLSCAIWIPEITIDDPEKMEPISNIDVIPMTRWNLICCVCRERSGACVQCCVKKCKASFHVTCGFKKNYAMKINYEDTGIELQFKAFCEQHSKSKEAPTTLSPKKGTQDLTSDEKKNIEKSRARAPKEEFYLYVNPEEVAEALDLDKECVSYVYEYWKLKRKSNFSKPLLMPKVEESAMLSKQSEDGLMAKLRMFINLRQDLERVRNLCYMVIRRERTKTQHQQLKRELFVQQADTLGTDKLKPGSKEYEHVRCAHRRQTSIYDDPSQVELAARIYEGRLAAEPKDDDDDDNETFEFNFVTNNHFGGPSACNESILNASKSTQSVLKSPQNTPKVKGSISSPSLPSKVRPVMSATKVRKRVSSVEPGENPYARPKYKNFSWMLNTRKKRKLNVSESTDCPPVGSSSDPNCTSRRGDGAGLHLHKTRSSSDVSESKHLAVKSETCVVEEIEDQQNPASPSQNDDTQPTSLVASGVEPPSLRPNEENSTTAISLDVNIEEKSEVRDDARDVPVKKVRTRKHVVSNQTKSKDFDKGVQKRRRRSRTQKGEMVPEGCVDPEVKLPLEIGNPSPLDGTLAAETIHPGPALSESAPPNLLIDNNPVNTSKEFHSKQTSDKSRSKGKSAGMFSPPPKPRLEEKNSRGQASPNQYSPDVLCSGYSDVHSPNVREKSVVLSPRENDSRPPSEVKKKRSRRRPAIESSKSPPINGIPASKVVRKISKKKLLKTSSDLESKIPASRQTKRSRAARDRPVRCSSIQSVISPSSLASNRLHSPSPQQQRSEIEEKKESVKNGVCNSAAKFPEKFLTSVGSKSDDDFVDLPKFCRLPVGRGSPIGSRQSTNRSASKMFNKKNVTPIIKSFQATLDMYLKSKDEDKTKQESTAVKMTSESTKNLHTPAKGLETQEKRSPVMGEKKQLHDITARVVLKIDRLLSLEKISPTKFPQPPDKKTLKSNNSLPKKKSVGLGKKKEARQKYPTRNSLSGCN